MASPPTSTALSQATPPPSFTPTNDSRRIIHSAASSPSQTNGMDARSGDEASSPRSAKRSHDSMMKDSMDIDYSSPSRPQQSAGSPSVSVATPRGDEKDRQAPSSAAGQTSMSSTNPMDKDTPSKGEGSGSRRNYNTSFSGAKIKHLKKADGEPL